MMMLRYLFIGPILAINTVSYAEIVTDGTLGTATTLTGPNYQIPDTLGQQVGRNLFHSFQDFNLHTGENAYFTSPPTVENVLARVTGDHISTLDGTLHSTIPNFYLLNPHGFLFGPHFQLDLTGTFYVSTAAAIELGKFYFWADSVKKSKFTSAPPEKFGFLDSPPATITIDGDHLTIRNSTYYAPNGQINITADNLRLENSHIDVSGDNGSGQIFVRAGQLFLDKSYIFADTSGKKGTTINIVVDNDMFLHDGARITTDNLENGQGGGDISITANTLQLDGLNPQAVTEETKVLEGFSTEGLSTIATNNFSKNGNGGNIVINTSILTMKPGFIQAATENLGDAGKININAQQVILETAAINAGTADDRENTDRANNTGRAGHITINATDKISLRNAGSIAVASSSDGDAGDISLTTSQLILENAGHIGSFNKGTGQPGSIFIDADDIVIVGQDSPSGITTGADNARGGNIIIQARNSFNIQKSRIDVIAGGKNKSGNITISNPQSLIIGDYSELFADAYHNNAGNIAIQTDQLMVVGQNQQINGQLTVNSKKLDNLAILPKNFTQVERTLKKCRTEKEASSFELKNNPVERDKLLNLAKYVGIPTDLTAQRIALQQHTQALFQQHSLPFSDLEAVILQWRHGRLLAALHETGAIDAYRLAIHALMPFRAILNEEYKKAQRSSFQEIFKPLYIEFIDLLLQQTRYNARDRENLLKNALEKLDELKTAELQDYFKDGCPKPTLKLPDDLGPNTAVVYFIFLPDRLESILYFGKNQFYQISTPNVQEITEEIETLHESLSSNKHSSTYKKPATQLYEWLWYPLESFFNQENTHTIIVVPDGPLYTVPLSVLYDARQKQFLLEKSYALTMMPGLTLTVTELASTAQIDNHSALYGVLSEPCPRKLSGFIFDTQKILESFSKTVKPLKGQDFTVAVLEKELHEKPFPLIHLYSHAQFGGEGKETFISTCDDSKRLDMGKLEELLSARKLSNTPVELLVLGACETAKGDKQKAAFGLAGSAFKAGVHSVVGTLWKVEDGVSFEIFKEFYENFKYLPKAQALQKAQRKFMKEHPDGWSPFLLVGTP